MADTSEEKLDKIAAHLDSMHARMDSWDEERKADRAKLDAACGFMDSMKMKADAEEKEKEEKAKADAEEKEKADKARADAEAQEAEKAKNDAAARADMVPRAEFDALKAIIEQPEVERSKFVAVQAKWDRVVQAFGDSAGAERFQPGERFDAYRRRMASAFKKHSPQWKAVDLAAMSDQALDIVEAQIYTDALSAAMHPASAPEGTLRMVSETDSAGRRINRFVGDERAAWKGFANPDRKGYINTRVGRA